MSFNASIPLVTDPTSQSFYQIRANFKAINETFSNNHIGLTEDSSISGKHRVIVFRPQSNDPTTAATEIGLYNKLVTNVPQLFFRPNNSQTPIQLTYSSISTGATTATPPVYFLRQYSFVAGPFVIYGGLIKGVASGTTITLLPVTTLLHVDLITENAKIPSFINSVAVVNLAGNSFDVKYTTSPAGQLLDIFYTAIGKP